MTDIGRMMYGWACELFPICRSITGDGTRQSLAFLKGLLPDLQIHEVPTGTKAFDWTVPKEWNIRDAFVADEQGNRIIDFRKHNLHVVGYSVPVDEVMTFDRLDAHLYSIPDNPDAIPFVTSYYERRWGFCLTENFRDLLRKKPKTKYHVLIDSTLAPGHLSYGELIIPGRTAQEILLSTDICHPSMANNELSGPCVTAALAQWIGAQQNRRFTYRILFLPETIGSIVYLSRHAEVMKKNTAAGFVVICVGDHHHYSYLESREGDTLADQVARHVLGHHAPGYLSYSYLERGSDERQYCSPEIDLPVCCVMRSKHATYPEYHTSLDNLEFISPEGLEGSYEMLRKCLRILEANVIYRTTVACEPQLGKRGLYANLSNVHSSLQAKGRLNDPMLDFLAYTDGKNTLLDIADRIGIDAEELASAASKLAEAKLLRVIEDREGE